MDRQDEIKVRSMIKNALDKEMSLQKKQTEKEIKKQIDANKKQAKKEFITFVQKEIKKLDSKILNKKDIKDIIIKAFLQQSKFMWEKASVVTQYINKV